MGPIIGDILPLALGIAISPIPIIAAILMLLSPKAKGTSVGFLIGWVLGIVVAVVLFTLLASVIPEDDPDASKPISGVIKIVLGLALLFLALRQFFNTELIVTAILAVGLALVADALLVLAQRALTPWTRARAGS